MGGDSPFEATAQDSLQPLDLPLSLRAYGSDLVYYEKVFVQREYLVTFESEPKLIVDAGANIGMATVFQTTVS